LNSIKADYEAAGVEELVIIGIGKEDFSADNENWLTDISLPIVLDTSPSHPAWTSWNANQWDLFFLDDEHQLAATFNIYDWDKEKIEDTIDGLLPKTLSITPITTPGHLSFLQVYPNPFNPYAHISFNLEESGEVSLTLFDVGGREVYHIHQQQFMSRGYQHILLNASHLSAGCYLLKTSTSEEALFLPVTLLK
jgi:hypothetical protein